VKISIIGAGSFGSALTLVASRCNNEVMLWAHERQVVDSINSTRSNPLYLPQIAFAENVQATNDLAEAAAFSDTIVMVVPSHHYRGVLKQLAKQIRKTVQVVSATKGIENKSLARMSEIVREVLDEKLRAVAVLSGPTFAAETARGDPTAAVIASSDVQFAEAVQKVLSSATFRLYNSTDIVGVELAGSLKNLIAIAAGVLEGLGLGYNTTAALITRGLHEITRLGIALGGRPETFAGLAGMGDLVLTCTGALSRNRSLGVALGKGRALNAILSETREVAEGVKTSKSAKELAVKHQIEMPITAEMYRVLYENEAPRDALQRLMTRSLKAEAAR
jgi:glycerol-3-phosphate dehydrogenase (NAD(P)+)